MSMTKGTRPIDASNLARRIREYMDYFPNATTRLATCRVILSMLGDEKQTPTLRSVTREQAEKVWKGEWIGIPNMGVYDIACSKCGYSTGIRFWSSDFCPACGAPMTDKAVDMVMERLETLR